MELLTGECKKKFEEWYKLEFEKRSLPYIHGFYVFDLSVQYGVLVDFFDSVGVFIDIDISFDIYKIRSFNSIIFTTIDDEGVGNPWVTERSEAQKQAIQKANELFNNK